MDILSEIQSGGNEYRIAELARRLANTIRLGSVEEADYKAARVRVRSGDMLTGWLPWLTARASNDIDWWAPEIGEQVLVLSPDGEPAQGVVLHSVYQRAHPAPEGRPTVRTVRFADGAYAIYDREAKKLTAYTPGDADLTADGSVAAEAGQDVTAKVGGSASAEVAKKLTAKVGVSASVQAGTSITLNAPQINIQGVLSQVGPGGGHGSEEKDCDTEQTGQYQLNGDLTVNGSISASGDILAGGSNSNHHSH